eukprot:3746416-Alexandrium_andersonii.AAC.1
MPTREGKSQAAVCTVAARRRLGRQAACTPTLTGAAARGRGARSAVMACDDPPDCAPETPAPRHSDPEDARRSGPRPGLP